MSNEDVTKASSRADLAAAVEARQNPPVDESEENCDECAEVEESFTFCVGNYDVRYSAITGKLTRIKARDMQDGWYDSVRVEDGAIKEYKKDGKNITVLNAECCPEDKNDDTEDEVRLMANKCNLTSNSQDGLLTKFEWVDCDEFARLKGCGSKDLPFGIKIPWDEVREQFFAPGITAKRCDFEVEDGLITKLPAKIITGYVNESPGVLNITCDDDCKLHIELVGAISGKEPVWEKEINCQTDSDLADGVVGASCDDGAGTVASDTTSGFTAQVFENTDGTHVINQQSDSTARFCNQPPNSFPTLGAAQAWIEQQKTLICGCPSICVPN